MDLSINLSYLMKRNNGGGRPDDVEPLPNRSFQEAIDMAKEIGYKKIDFNGFNSGCKNVDEMCEILKNSGLVVNQSHAPCNYWPQRPTEEFQRSLLTSIERANLIGSKIFVVHGNQIDKKNMTYSYDSVLEYNYRLYAPVVEYAENHGMKVAFETIPQIDEPKLFCSYTEELIALTEKFSDTKGAGICWDFGHANATYDPWSLKELAKTKGYLISTHVHDNAFGKDMHTLPFLGNINWDRAMQTLKHIDYQGDFTFEFVYNNYPEALFMDFMKLAYKSGQYLLSL